MGTVTVSLSDGRRASAEVDDTVKRVCGCADYFYAVYEKGLPRCPACVEDERGFAECRKQLGRPC